MVKNIKLQITLLLLLLASALYIASQLTETTGYFKAEVVEKNVRGSFSKKGPRVYCSLRLESGEKIKATPCNAKVGDVVTVAKIKQLDNKSTFLIQSSDSK